MATRLGVAEQEGAQQGTDSIAKPIQHRLNGDFLRPPAYRSSAVSPPGEQAQAMIGNTWDEGAAAASTYVASV